jgi:4-amino-4-deoxy-L-arabinose transferase-like glycosyltransferase
MSRALVVLQIAAILVVGVATVARFHVFAEVDERAHLAYVQEVAERGHIPWVGRDRVPWQEVAFEAGTYPQSSALDLSPLSLRGSSYEGWQPPLYYVLAAPAFLIPSGYSDKVYAVRSFDLLLLLVALAILALLARAVFDEHWQGAYCLALSPILWPGVIVRAVTVSNAALELPLVALYVLVLWKATAKPRPRSLLAAGALLGLCVLTQLTLVCLSALLLVPLAALLRERRDRRAVATATLTLLLPLALVAPWLALNESRYGALTASSLVERLTAPDVPAGSGLSAVGSGLVRLSHVMLPQEWWLEYRGMLGAILITLPTLLVVVCALAVVRRPWLVRSRAGGLLAAALPLGIATLAGIVLLDAWPAALLPRYLNPALPLFALFVAWAWLHAGMGQRSLLWLAGLSGAVVCPIWVYMAGAYYFTNVGAMLGIHAAR